MDTIGLLINIYYESSVCVLPSKTLCVMFKGIFFSILVYTSEQQPIPALQG